MGRLLRSVPELAKLVKGMVQAARSVVFILIFLILIMYVFSIIFTGTLSDRDEYPLTPYCSQELAAGLNESDECLADHEFGETGQDLFATMGDSFMSLFTRGVLGDNLAETVQAILDASLMLMWMFWIFEIITFATLLNMLIGVICGVISQTAAEEEESVAENMVKDTIMESFASIDADGNGKVTSEEWAHIQDNPKVREAFTHIGVEKERMEERLQQMRDMIFMDEDPDLDDEEPNADDQHGYTVEELIEKVGELRPDLPASALDLELMQATVKKDQKLFVNKLKRMEGGVRKYVEKQKELKEKEAETKKREKERLLREDAKAKKSLDAPKVELPELTM